jgi:hypothetical protein
MKENFDDAKGVIRSLRRTDNTMAKRIGTNGRTTIHKTMHRTIKIEQHEPTHP